MIPIDWSLVAFIAYALVGVCVFLYFAITGWQTGNAVDFVLWSVSGAFIGVFWIPAGLLYLIASIFFGGLQWFMNLFRPKPTYKGDIWDKYYNALTALDEEIYKDEIQ